MLYSYCFVCGELAEEADEYCPYCGEDLDDEDPWLDDYRGPYDDEGDLAYSDTARGEWEAEPVPPTMNNPAYPPRQSAS